MFAVTEVEKPVQGDKAKVTGQENGLCDIVDGHEWSRTALVKARKKGSCWNWDARCNREPGWDILLGRWMGKDTIDTLWRKNWQNVDLDQMRLSRKSYTPKIMPKLWIWVRHRVVLLSKLVKKHCSTEGLEVGGNGRRIENSIKAILCMSWHLNNPGGDVREPGWNISLNSTRRIWKREAEL